MDNVAGGRYARDRKFLLTVYFIFYFTVFIFQAIDHRLLSQVRPLLFNYNRDLVELALITVGLPKWMIVHPLSFEFFDALLFILPLAWLAGSARRRWLGIAFVLFLALYQLLANIFWQVHHEPFILYLLLPLALITRRKDRFYQLLQACRYYFLYIFISAAIWKIARGAIFNGEEMSRILLTHHADLLSGDCTGWACQFYSWLIDHPFAAQLLYLGSTALEACFILGFFTRRFDRLLLALALLFVVADLLIMRIPYWTILLGATTLWLDTRPRDRVMVIYETTHHENLPALLDLCATRFPRVIVFLKHSSYQNISGSEPLAARWPKTEFIVQQKSNRHFISMLFRHLRTQRCSHLHLSTLDNNLLVFAAQLCLAPALQVSLTIHEVNEYFTHPAGTLRDLTETLAKPLLHRRIKHYSFFLPAMAQLFQEKMPRATTVFIPSRFYRPQKSEKTQSIFTIAIPGSVDGNRRDYESVIRIIRSCTGQAPPIRLVVLGDSSSVYGTNVITQLAATGLEIRHYTGYIPEAAYEQEIEAADLLWSPLRVQKLGSRNNPERYGLTTASGLTADLLLNNIPALAPAEFVLPEPFRTALLSYSTAEQASQLLLQLTNDENYRRQLRQNIDKAFAFFKKENFAVAFATLTALPEEGQKGGTDPVDAIRQDI
jgi:glycosyltransferase involved in cell wall biosynthesis